MPIMESDARVIEEPAGGPRCQVCETPIRSDGSGQRPSYCGRGCSSKAYRARVKERQNATLAAALNASREPSSELAQEVAQELARLGSLVERTAQSLAQTLDKGADPMHVRVSLSSLERAAGSLLAKARTAARQAVADRDNPARNASREPSTAAPADVALPTPAPAAAAAAPAPQIPPRPRPAADPSPRQDSREPYRSTLNDSREPSSESVPPRFDLVPPVRRGLGPATHSTPLQEIGPGWELLGWSQVPTLLLVAHEDQEQGWVEHGVGGVNRWLAVAGMSYLVDRAGQPLWHASPRSAARTVAVALRDGLV